MDFEQKKKENSNEKNYNIENLRIAREFSKNILLEMKELVKSIVVFGSNTNNTENENSDIDIMIVLDNVSVFVSPELRESYKIISNKIISNISNKIHLMTINFSDLWDMSRKGDPILVNILRYGVPIFDRDIIEPLQYLLEIGKIRPSKEAIFNYIGRSENLILDVQKHIQDAYFDIYYALVDMIHATLMIQKKTPPSPKDMPQIFSETFKDKKLAQYSKDIKEMYEIIKELEYENKSKKLSGENLDKYYKKISQIILELKEFNLKEIQKKEFLEI